MSMDTDFKKIKKILKLLEESDFNEIEWEEADFKIRVKKTPPEPPDQRFFNGIQSIQPDYPKSLPVPQGTQTQETELELAEGRAIIRSPLVGTFYRAPSPSTSVFVNVGDNDADFVHVGREHHPAAGPVPFDRGNEVAQSIHLEIIRKVSDLPLNDSPDLVFITRRAKSLYQLVSELDQRCLRFSSIEQ